MGFASRLLEKAIASAAAGAVNALYVQDNAQAEARKAEAAAKMSEYENQRKQMELEYQNKQAQIELQKQKIQVQTQEQAQSNTKKHGNTVFTEGNAREFVEPLSAPVATLDPEQREYFLYLSAAAAVSWYVASMDELVSETEISELYKIMNKASYDKRIPSDYKKYFQRYTNYSKTSFATVKMHLDRVTDRGALVDLAVCAENIARSGGITDRERKAIDALKLYIENRTGYHFDDLYRAPAEADLICPSCGGKMVLHALNNQATCTYCGYTKIFDVKKL
ncbi:MAG: hypothetical protein K6F79_03955 [Saccharofermentans sp.]|nr:hypothetical protein [Saccharofermentans sp.]